MATLKKSVLESIFSEIRAYFESNCEQSFIEFELYSGAVQVAAEQENFDYDERRTWCNYDIQITLNNQRTDTQQFINEYISCEVENTPSYY
jgi:hypothetical protein